MDFLDPRKRRAHNIRLMIGYGLVAIAIGLTSVILVYGAYGYGINTKTGELIQNGLLFVDSKPADAGIYLNGQQNQSPTGARLTLPAGSYELTVKKADRKYSNGTLDIAEKDITHRIESEAMYLRLARERKNWVKIDCVGSNGILLSKEEIHAKIIKALQEKHIIS